MDSTHDVINEFIDKVSPGKPTTVELATKLTTGTTGPREALTVTLRKPIEMPVRAESPARSHTFNSVQGFVEYLQRYGSGQDVLVLADPDTGAMTAVLNEKAMQGFETVRFMPKIDPLYKPWHEKLNDVTKIKDFARFIQSHKTVIEGDKAQLCALFQQIRLSKNVTMQQGIGARSTNGVMVAMTLQGQVKDVPMDLPESLTILCPMFVDTQETAITMDLLVEVSHDDVYIRMSSSDAEVQKVALIQQMLTEVKSELTAATISMGTVEHEEWDYVKPPEGDGY